MHCAGQRHRGACGSRSMLTRRRWSRLRKGEDGVPLVRLENPRRPRAGRRGHGRHVKKGQSGFQSRAQRAWSVSGQPQKRGILASGTLWWLQWAIGAESGAVKTVQSGRNVPGPWQSGTPPTHQRKDRRIQTRCPLSALLAVAALPFQKNLSTAPTKPQIQARQQRHGRRTRTGAKN